MDFITLTTCSPVQGDLAGIIGSSLLEFNSEINSCPLNESKIFHFVDTNIWFGLAVPASSKEELARDYMTI